jgi:hypothetical protein
VEKGEPFPGGPQTIPYEDVLDHSDLVLSGEVKEVGADALEIGVAEVLKGEFKDKSARISYQGSWNTTEVDGLKAPEVGQTGTFLCLRGKDGALVLAGYPPKGGGFVEEGPALVRKMLDAAKDPAKGFESNDPAVKLSAAYRLARQWLAAPADAKPKLPAGLMDTLMNGLLPGDLAGRHVNAGARNCVNEMLGCNIISTWKYSVNHDSGRRETYGKDVIAAWERTVKAVRVRRSGKPDPDAPPKLDPGAAVQRAAALVKQLGADEFDKREAAERAIRAMGKDALEAVKAGAESKDAEVSDRCRAIIEALESGASRPADPDKVKFDLDAADRFVSDVPAVPAPPEPKKD